MSDDIAPVADASANPGADTITFDPTVFTPNISHSIILQNGTIPFTHTTGPTTITGPGSAVLSVDGNKTSQVFQISTGSTVNLTGLTVTNGANLTLTSVTVSNNTATGGSFPNVYNMPRGVGGASEGTGIYSTGPLTLITPRSRVIPHKAAIHISVRPH